MPVRSNQGRAGRARVGRAAVAALALIVLFTAGVGAATPAGQRKNKGENLTGAITSMRKSQLQYERAMLSADRRLHGSKKLLKKIHRGIRKTKRNFVRKKHARTEARQQLAETRGRLGDARALSRKLSTPPALPAIVPAASLATVAGPPSLAETRLRSLSEVGLASGGTEMRSESIVTPAEIDGLKKQVRKQKRRLRNAQRKVHKAKRAKRGKVRHLAAVKQRRRTAIANRAVAEAALKTRILSMSRLAGKRATKKTKRRPGRNTPFVWPVRGRISQGYGCTGSSFSPRRGTCSHFHDGLDIVSGSGAAIRAAGVGVISYVGRNPWDRGKRAFVVVIAHPGGYETLYAHVLPIRKVFVGQVVRKGQVIAFMGSTGHSTGTHLHLEFRRGRTTVNPLAFL